MTCHHISGLAFCRGPATEDVPMDQERSAAHCGRCRKRTVQRLVARCPIEPSYYGPNYYWVCKCGGSRVAQMGDDR